MQKRHSSSKYQGAVLFAAAASVTPFASRAIAVNYTVTNLNTGFTLGTGLTALGLNDSDQVVGYYYTPVGGFHEVPFIYTPTATTKYVSIPGFTSNAQATAINNAGVVVGSDLATGNGFVDSSGTVTEVAPLAGSSLTFAGINNNNMVVGTSSTSTSGVTRAVTYNISSSKLVDVGTGFSGPASDGYNSSGYSINDSGQIAGLGVNTGGTSTALNASAITEPFIAKPSGSSFTYNDIGTSISASRFDGPVSIDSQGDVAGSYVLTGNAVDSAFLFNASSSTVNTFTGWGDSYAVATVNGSPEVVGNATLHDPYIDPQPFSYQNGTLTNLHNYNPVSATLYNAFAINDNGDILAVGTTSTGATDYYLLTVNHTVLTYTGAVSGNWDTTTANFTPTLYSDGLPVIFDDTATGTTNVNIVSAVAPASVTFNNSSKSYVISGAAITGGATTTLSLTGHGTVTLTNSNTYAGATNVSGGTLIVSPTGSIASTAINVTGGTLRIENGGVLAAAATYPNLALTVGGTVELDSSPAGSPTVLLLSKLYISGSTNNWTGKLDLSNNAMIGAYGSTGQINLAQITNQIKSGFAGGTWRGNGITSSAAATDTSHLTALGVILNSPDGTTYDPNSIYTTFDGISVYSNDILVEDTYYGDANLDGQVDGSDYSLIDYAYLNNQNSSNPQLTGWYNGDFNYDGVINGSDYTLIDNAFNSQNGNLGGGTNPNAGNFAEIAAQISSPAGTTAVPEPTALMFVSAAALGMLGRRRSFKTKASASTAISSFGLNS